jgi:site-specific DNA-adenine methylase
MKDDSTGYVKGSDDFDYDRLNDVLQKTKGKFLMSLDNSRYIKQTFKNFKIKEVGIPINRQPKFRKELLISNYDFHL